MDGICVGGGLPIAHFLGKKHLLPANEWLGKFMGGGDECIGLAAYLCLFTRCRKDISFDMKDLVLASASPRRAELLQQIGLQFMVCAADIDETVQQGETPRDYVLRMAREKAQAIKQHYPEAVVLASDTSVVIDGTVLGKPSDEEDAHRMLSLLSGRTHLVLTSVCVLAEDEQCAVNQTEVLFREVSSSEMASYWASGEPADKAGAYAIQGVGAKFVQRINGSYSGVMGLPLFEVAAMLSEAGVVGDS